MHCVERFNWMMLTRAENVIVASLAGVKSSPLQRSQTGLRTPWHEDVR